MKYKFIIFIIVIVGFYSCNKKVDFDSFPEVVELTSDSLNIEEPFIMPDIALTDSILILYSVYKEKYCLYLFNKNNSQLIKKFGKKGKGPGEIQSPSWWHVYNKNIYVFDGGKSSFWRINIDSVLLNKNYKLTDVNIISKLPMKYFMFNGFNMIGDSIIALSTADNISLIRLIDLDRNELSNGPFTENDDLKRVPENDWKIRFNYSPEDSTFFVVNQLYSRLEAFSLNGKQKFSIYGPDKIKFKNNLNKNKWQIAYRNLLTDKKHIYCLYQNTENTKVERKDIETQYAKNLTVFDHQGQPVSFLKLDHEIITFAIDLESETIYCVTNEIPQFVTYSLKGLEL